MSVGTVSRILPQLQSGVTKMAITSRLCCQPFLCQHLWNHTRSHCIIPSVHVLSVRRESSQNLHTCTSLQITPVKSQRMMMCSQKLLHSVLNDKGCVLSRSLIPLNRNLSQSQLLCNKYEPPNTMQSNVHNFGSALKHARNFSNNHSVHGRDNFGRIWYQFSGHNRCMIGCYDFKRFGYHSSTWKCFGRRLYGTAATKETGDPLSPDSAPFKCYIEHLRKEHQTISDTLQGGEPLSDSKQRDLRGRQTEISSALDKWDELMAAEQELSELEKLIQGSAENSQDKEMQELASAEKEELVTHIVELNEELLDLMMPSQDTDDNDVIMEFSAGVGGQEAMLFAADMFNMYERYAAYRNWTFTILEYFTTDLGGLRHASASISGDQAYRLLRYEAGVHRVQRVPKTEKQGRIHTSTMAIAVLPQPKEIDLKLDPKDLKIETKKASGAGGQHVNTTDSAVRITHIPTGITAESQQERSQHKNRIIAMTVLETRIYSRILEKQTTSERSMRRSQVGTSGRSEKIRTYNYQQDRVTDHRISRSIHDVQDYLSGSDLLDEMVLSVIEQDEQDELKQHILEVYEASQKIS